MSGTGSKPTPVSQRAGSGAKWALLPTNLESRNAISESSKKPTLNESILMNMMGLEFDCIKDSGVVPSAPMLLIN